MHSEVDKICCYRIQIHVEIQEKTCLKSKGGKLVWQMKFLANVGEPKEETIDSFEKLRLLYVLVAQHNMQISVVLRKKGIKSVSF